MCVVVRFVRAFNDNYIYILHDGHETACVDPGDAQPVLRALNAWGVCCVFCLCVLFVCSVCLVFVCCLFDVCA